MGMTTAQRKLLLRRVKTGCFYLISSVLSILNNVKRRCLAGPNKTCDRILLLNTYHIGDFVLSSSIIRALRMVNPTIEFDVIVHPDNREIASLFPNVRKVWVFISNRGRGAGLPERSLDWSNLKNILKEISNREYDTFIILSPDTILNLLIQISFFIKKKAIRIYDTSSLELLNILTGATKRKHMLDVFRQLINPLLNNCEVLEFIPFIEISEANRQQCKSYPNGKFIIGFCIGAGWKYKKWNRVHFLNLADLILQEYNNALIMVYGYDAEDFETSSFIKNNCRYPERIEIFPRGGMMDFLKSLQQCSLVISHDSGPAHISSALAVPVITIFGPSDPEQFAPRGPSVVKVYWKKVECNPCDQFECFNPVKQKCMNTILPEEVYEGFREIVQKIKGEVFDSYKT